MQTVSQQPLKTYKCIVLLSMLYLLIIIMILLTNKKVVAFPIMGPLPVSIIFTGFLFVLGDVIAEVYGYRECRLVILQGLIMLGIFALSMTAIIHIPSTSMTINWAKVQDNQGYPFIFGTLLRDYFALILAYLLSTYTNAYLISKWKIFYKGRYFWLRSIGSSSISAFIYAVVVNFLIAHALIAAHDAKFLFKIMAVSFILKILTCMILAYPATLFCAILKRVEGVDVYDYGVRYNPFK